MRDAPDPRSTALACTTHLSDGSTGGKVRRKCPDTSHSRLERTPLDNVQVTEGLILMNAERSGPSDAPAPSILPTILVVEDEPLLRLWIADELRESGFTILEAASADEAMDVLGSPVPVQAVLTDVQMPGRMDGAALAEWLRRERPELKIIIASAHPPSIVAHALLAKPYSLAKVVETIEKLFGLDGTQARQPGPSP
jgi:two-component system, response regulator PdtaR